MNVKTCTIFAATLLLSFLVENVKLYPLCSSPKLLPYVKLALVLQNGSIIPFHFRLLQSLSDVFLQTLASDYCYRWSRWTFELDGTVVQGCSDGIVARAHRIALGEAEEDEWRCLDAFYDEPLLVNLPQSPYLARILADHSYLDFEFLRRLSSGEERDKDFCQLMRDLSTDVNTLDLLLPLREPNNPPRVLCIVYTIDSRHKNVEMIVNTWGGRCTGFLAFSNVSDLAIPTTSIPHLGEESYDNLWAKIVSIWRYVFENYRDEFEWFYLAGDDTYLLTENLYDYLNEFSFEKVQREGLFLGRRYYLDDFYHTYNTGGAGYVMNRVALTSLYRGLTHPDDPCHTTMVTSAEDVQVSACLRLFGHILPHETRDERYDHRERFHHLSLTTAWTYSPKNISWDWWSLHTLEFRNGSGCCSPRSISFHYIKTFGHMIEIDTYIRRCKQSQNFNKN